MPSKLKVKLELGRLTLDGYCSYRYTIETDTFILRIPSVGGYKFNGDIQRYHQTQLALLRNKGNKGIFTRMRIMLGSLGIYNDFLQSHVEV